MKLIVEMPDSEYNDLKGLYLLGLETPAYKTFIEKTCVEAITNGTPYNPSGDLISREALKKALKSNCNPELCHDYNTAWCEHNCPHNDFEDLIDNAQAVEITEEQAIDVLHHHGWLVVCSEHKAVQDVNHKVYRNENCPQKHKCYDYQGYHCSGCNWEKKGGAE